VSGADADARRAETLHNWERAAAGWSKRADRVREVGMQVSIWMIDQLGLQPGQRVLELAAGPGDTGFLAAELIEPGGTLVCSDGAEAMVEVARSRARALGVRNVEFAQLELEWIDLETASVDAIICRWGLMLSVDSGAALREARRVLRPGGRLAVSVWDEPAANPWATIPTRALVELGHTEPPDRGAPGMFALAAPGALQEALEGAGFVEVVLDAVQIERAYPSLEQYVDETRDLSVAFATALGGLTDGQLVEVRHTIASLTAPFTGPDGAVALPGRSLVAVAGA
jgi:SAM-dependent methyltransferase